MLKMLHFADFKQNQAQLVGKVDFLQESVVMSFTAHGLMLAFIKISAIHKSMWSNSDASDAVSCITTSYII